jgi:hypothetical protein
MAKDFADYTTATVTRLGDRIKYWMTINEIFCFTYMGYGVGKVPQHAPGTVVQKRKGGDRRMAYWSQASAHGCPRHHNFAARSCWTEERAELLPAESLQQAVSRCLRTVERGRHPRTQRVATTRKTARASRRPRGARRACRGGKIWAGRRRREGL